MLHLRSYLVAAVLAAASPALADTAPESTAQAELAATFADAMSRESHEVWFHKLIEFAPASSRVYSVDRELLQRMAKTWVQSGQQMVITVHGYSDSLDLDLAERRAAQVRGYLIKAGVSPSRVVAVGHTLDKGGRRIDLSIGSCERGQCAAKHAAK